MSKRGGIGAQQQGMAGNGLDAVARQPVGHRVLEVGTDGRVVAHADDQHLAEVVSGVGGVGDAGHQLRFTVPTAVAVSRTASSIADRRSRCLYYACPVVLVIV